ncbi:MAG: hypothetical protein FJ041_02505 [Candidatus Cloacimonetes bacterium]|nr:hypothetical protein [Candidatus Cloacimonadota bacterium]
MNNKTSANMGCFGLIILFICYCVIVLIMKIILFIINNILWSILGLVIFFALAYLYYYVNDKLDKYLEKRFYEKLIDDWTRYADEENKKQQTPKTNHNKAKNK